MDPTFIVATTTDSEVVIPTVGLDVGALDHSLSTTSPSIGAGGDGFGGVFQPDAFGNGSLGGGLGGDGFFGWLAGQLGGLADFFSGLWSAYSILAYLFSIGFLVAYVYATIQKKMYEDLQTQTVRDFERLYAEQYLCAGGSRLKDVNAHVESDNPNDWKLAIIEADILLADALVQRGYVGNTLGERLKGLTTNQLHSLDDAWEAHKVRNRIAHEGSDFVLTKRLAQETIMRYQRVLNELGVQ